jgi:hypothetical protein
VLFRALSDPDGRIALRFGERALTYRQLRDAAAAVAERAGGIAVQPDERARTRRAQSSRFGQSAALHGRQRIDIPAAAMFAGLSVDQLSDLDLSYTRPFGSPWDAVQVAARRGAPPRASQRRSPPASETAYGRSRGGAGRWRADGGGPRRC